MEKNSKFEAGYSVYLAVLMGLSVLLFILAYLLDSDVILEFTRYCLVTFILSLLIPLFEKSQTD